jgi:hypothetical protein
MATESKLDSVTSESKLDSTELASQIEKVLIYIYRDAGWSLDFQREMIESPNPYRSESDFKLLREKCAALIKLQDWADVKLAFMSEKMTCTEYFAFCEKCIRMSLKCQSSCGRTEFNTNISWYMLDQKAFDFLADFMKDKKVLEIGAGRGLTACFLQDAGIDITPSTSV